VNISQPKLRSEKFEEEAVDGDGGGGGDDDNNNKDIEIVM